MFAPLSLLTYLVNRHISGILSRGGRREAKVVLARDAAKSGKERAKKGIPVLDYQNRAQSSLALSASFKRIGVY